MDLAMADGLGAHSEGVDATEKGRVVEDHTKARFQDMHIETKE